MSARFTQKYSLTALLCLLTLTTVAAACWLAYGVSTVSSAGGDNSSRNLVVQTPTDNVFRLAIKTNDLVYNPQDQMIYTTRPGSAGSEGNSISRIDPLTGAIAGSVFIGSEPNRLAISDDGQVIYVTLDGAYAVRRYSVATQTPGMQFPIGRQDTNSTRQGAPYLASDIAVAPGDPDLVAVARTKPGISPPGAGVAIFDAGVQRQLTGPGHSAGANFLAFSTSAATLYGGGFYGGLRTMTVDANGVTDISGNGTPFSVRNLKFENDLIFTSNGQIIDPQTPELLGTCAGINSAPAFVPVTESGRVIYAVRESSSPHITIRACDTSTYEQIGMLTVPDVYGSPTALVRYGTNGLAMRTSNDFLYFIQTSLIPTGAPLPPPDPAPTPTPTPTPTYSLFVREVDLPNKDIIYSQSEQKIYASVPDGAAQRTDSITRIAPATGLIESSVPVGDDPGRLALSADEQTMYVGIDGENAVRKFDITTGTPGFQFPLGNGVNGPKTAYDIDLMPGSPNTVAVSYGSSSYSYDGADIFDEGVKRAFRADAGGPVHFVAPDLLYIGENWLYKYSVGPSGMTEQGNFVTTSSGEAVLSGGLLYTPGGPVIDPATAEFKGTYAGVGYRAVIAVDQPNNRVFFLTDEYTGRFIRAYRLDNFLPVGSISLRGLSLSNDMRRLLRWGENGLALTNKRDKIFLLQSDLVSQNGTVPTGTQLGSPNYARSEGSGSLQVRVVRTGDLNGTTTIDYATADGTATAGTDYTAVSGTLTYEPGETEKTVDIPLNNDNIYEPDETFAFNLSNPGGDGIVEILAPAAAELKIYDNDNLPALSSPEVSIEEPPAGETRTAMFTVELTNPSSQTATVNYATEDGTATAGEDYTAANGTLTFKPLETSKTISVEILADQNYDEPDETFAIRFSNALNVSINNSRGTATIINLDPRPARRSVFDFDGDGRTDIGTWRPAAGEWWYTRSSDGAGRAFQFGDQADRIAPADFTGDGAADIAFWREQTGEWFVLRSEDSSFYAFPFGAVGDVPVPGDYDGDGRADPALFRPAEATWYILNSNGGTTIRQFGLDGDVPVAGDFDGDGRADLAVFRPNAANGAEWYIEKSSDQQVSGFQFGLATDRAAPADFTGDGAADIAFWREQTGEWFVLRSEDSSFYAFPFGAQSDIPVPGDYDGDGRSDPAVFRPAENTWYLQQTTDGFAAVGFGVAGDVPIPSAFLQ